MNLTPLNDDLDIIAKLDDEPNDVGGMTPSELKAQFDLAGNLIKAYLNGTLLPALQIVADTAANIDGIDGVLHTLVNDDTKLVTGKAVAEAMQSSGYGDMMKATYDTDNDGKVDTAAVADEAVKLQTPRTISLSGGASGSATFDGTGNVSIPVSDIDPTALKTPVPITRGGTGASTAAAALWNFMNALGIRSLASTDKIPFADVSDSTTGYTTLANMLQALADLGAYRSGGTDVAVADGGTGASTAAEARTNLGITPENIGAAASAHTHDAADVTSGTFPVARGGTGADNAADARTNLGITPDNIGAIGKGTELWTNESPAVGFAAQTLTIDNLSDYNLFMIVCRRNESTAAYVTHFVHVPDGATIQSAIFETVLSSGSAMNRYRPVTIDKPAGTVTFGAGDLTGGTYYPASILIPQYIVGFSV
jgi:hypothetical protein